MYCEKFLSTFLWSAEDFWKRVKHFMISFSENTYNKIENSTVYLIFWKLRLQEACDYYDSMPSEYDAFN